MNFNIIEQKTINYEAAKQDYLNGIVGDKLRAKHNMGSSAYTRLLQRFREDGLNIPMNCRNLHRRKQYEGKYYYRVVKHGKTYWVVKKWINNKMVYFGYYKTRAEAEQKVIELKENNWEGLL